MDGDAFGVEMRDSEAGFRAVCREADALIAVEPPIGEAVRVFAHADEPGHGGGRRRWGGHGLLCRVSDARRESDDAGGNSGCRILRKNNFTVPTPCE